ncbi:MAG: dihydroorotate dehydrogenase electron transfer subunit [Gammaproteobacteria bacterium]|nr:dihydroorotate dehydrogenase electron transfer subunit [Gammaproteobacteria bacterium]MCY4282266.1 dihydroorotate dehydrogenase electron transfer subunit [Gammaproteobacteria bacterium]MCY4337748.1 dihydroorotate dehydrogenase electron transfer subunit [Gammaproteobacteria bacterium]
MNESPRHPATRATIFVEDAAVVQQQPLAAEQYLLRLAAGACAAQARPGSFVHLRCHEALPMRRPMSIMRADPNAGWIDILYKVHGQGTQKLAGARPGDHINLLGPIGTPFKLQGYRRFPLLIGGGVGIPPMVFLAEHIATQATDVQPLVIMGSEIPFPFQPRPSQVMVDGVPPEALACMPLLEDWGIPSRLTSKQGYPGCYDGFVTDLARLWLSNLAPSQRQQVELFSCGPTPMLHAVAELAAEFSLPCQISVEEYMACATGGCAGCAIPVYRNGETIMQRVCVDGPVFEAAEVYNEHMTD